MSTHSIDIARLSAIDRVRLIGELWDGLPDSSQVLSEVQRRELDARADALEQDIVDGRPLGAAWSDVIE